MELVRAGPAALWTDNFLLRWYVCWWYLWEQGAFSSHTFHQVYALHSAGSWEIEDTGLASLPESASYLFRETLGARKPPGHTSMVRVSERGTKESIPGPLFLLGGSNAGPEGEGLGYGAASRGQEGAPPGKPSSQAHPGWA